jgi:hypothetical protein
MNDVLTLLDKIGLKKLRVAIRQKLVGRGGREQVIRVETVVKIGKPHVLKREYRAYVHFARFLTKKEGLFLFPRVAFGSVSPMRAILAIEPIPGSTFEETILKISELAKRHGWKSKEVRTHQKFVQRLAMKVLAKLAILHRPIGAIKKRVELTAFIRELIRGLTESLRRGGILWDSSSLFVKIEGIKEMTVCLAHRDLGLLNIITDGEDVFFIDPRSHVVSTPNRRIGARFASPAIDLVALFVGLERCELEIRKMQPNFRLSAKQCVVQEIKRRLQNKQISPFIFCLSETAVWAGYTACRCSQCLDPDRAWLRKQSIVRTMKCLKTLLRLS